ncbi:MAG: hypothetical protein HYY18_11410 [Planctomycetes bacterium]|nr:hypothetical protein [Planctomycetota bacterium]
MRNLTLAAVLLALAAAPACAQERAWEFKPGQTYTYELYTYFHYTVTDLDRGMSHGEGSDGEMTKGGKTTPEEGGRKMPPEKGKPPCY